jgi:hypothetical protein
LGEPFAIALAGVILLFLSSDWSLSQIAYIASALSFLYFILALILRYNYPIAMIANLKSTWLDLTYDYKNILKKIPKEESMNALEYQKNPKFILLVLAFIREYNAPSGIKILFNFLNTKDIQVFSHSQDILRELLNSHDPKVLYEIRQWTKNTSNIHSILLKKELAIQGLLAIETSSLLDKRLGIKEKGVVAVNIFNSQYPEHLKQAIDIMYAFLYSEKTEELVEGLYILGQSNHTPYAFYASEFLNHSNEKVVLEALRSIHSLANTEIDRLVLPMLKIFDEGSKEQRLLSIKILAKIKDTHSIILLLEKIESISVYEKSEILLMIKGMGLQAIPALVTVLIESNFSYFARSIAGRALG